MESELGNRFLLGRPLVLAGGVIVLAFSTARLWPGGTDFPVFEAAGGVAVALLCIAAWVSRARRSLWLALVVPVGCDLLVGLLRQSQGGSTSGYAPLALVPVVWTGLVLGRRGVLVISGSTTLLFALPLVIVGPPLYPGNGWRGVVLWSLISLFVGFGADRVMRAGEDQIEIAEARVVVLDLNGFKQINDRQGHVAGDRLLRTAAACWSTALRASDILGRIGGDEFAVILEQTDGATAAVVAERLEGSLTTGEVTVATGIATCERSEDAASLLSRADAAMYGQKNGRAVATPS